ncbi:TPA: hypothetical protein HMM51_24240 [Escherichia coli]|uniref:hypothetical protein n=1 Tax=Escherichia coli TaxID=562 RepID=UPI0003914E1F|nr:hypothetical protein [Escherichia coli]ERA97449.1 hypothetical protein G880_05108 [Escherichia coli KOEGE 10 (25a)]HAI8250085.1 hypothetical protein [Escherichia coli]HAJ2292444.1 hypothetical protein [Escherichia coli]
MTHKSAAGELQKEVENTTVLLDDILNILALLEAGDWSEHCTKTELGGRLEREITRLIGDAQEATVTSYELIAEAWRLMDGQDPKTSDWHSKASKYLNSNRVEKVDDVKPKPVDHGFRDHCECSSCQTTARICAELTDKSSLIYEVNVGGNTWVECTRAAYVRAKDKGELTRVVAHHPNNELKDHQIRELVNELRDIAVSYHGTQQLREKIARAVNNSLKGGESQPKRIRITHIGENGTEIPQFSVGDIFDVHGEEFGEPHITMPSGHVYWLRAMEKYGDKWEVL